MATANDSEHMQPPTKPRISPLEYRNTDLVSRLLAATPPYLYNMSMAPNTYFFSEMLRSFVQAKSERTATAIARRPRKRTWTQTRSVPDQNKHDKPSLEEWKPETHFFDDNKPTAIPQDALKDRNFPIFPQNSVSPGNQAQPAHPQHQHQSAENSSNLILPPPPPIWYPPLYSGAPYGIDPLHFFIDLRVSGHIYDRKKALEKDEGDQVMVPPTIPNFFAENTNKSNVLKTSRHASAFSVPAKNHPINLSKVEGEYKPLKFDVKSLGLENTCNKTGINYVMNNIERVYKDLQDCNQNSSIKQENLEDHAKKKQQKDGIDLVVDYMYKRNHKQLGYSGNIDDANHYDMDSSSVVEVVDLQDESLLDS